MGTTHISLLTHNLYNVNLLFKWKFFQTQIIYCDYNLFLKLLHFNNCHLIPDWVHFKTSVCHPEIISSYLETRAFSIQQMTEAWTSGFAIFPASRTVNLCQLKNRTKKPTLLPVNVNVQRNQIITSLTVLFHDFLGLWVNHSCKFCISGFFVFFFNMNSSFLSDDMAPFMHLEKYA